MTDQTHQSSYSRARKQQQFDDNFQTGEERGGSQSIVMNSGDGIMAQYLQNANPYQITNTDQQNNHLGEYQNEYEGLQQENYFESGCSPNGGHNQNNYENVDVDNLEISFEDDAYNALGKTSKLRQLDQQSDRPMSNLDDPMIGIDIDEGQKNLEFNNITPLRETIRLSQHNKFASSAFKGITQTLNFHEQSPQINNLGDDNPTNNYFDPMFQLDQDEIDKILEQNNVSPLNKNVIQTEVVKEGQKLNLVSDFNFDFIDDDNICVEQQQEEDFKNNYNEVTDTDRVAFGTINHEQYGDHVIGEDELFQDLEKRRQATLESQKEDENQFNNASNKKKFKKPTNSALGNYQSNRTDKKSLLSSSKKSKQSKLKQKNKLSFNDYYQMNNKTTSNRNHFKKDSTISASQESQKSDYRQKETSTAMETKASNHMKLDLLKRKMNSMKIDKSQTISQSTKAQSNENKKFKFQRLELPDEGDDSISGDDTFHKKIPTEGSQKDNIVLHNNIPKFNQIQSKTQLDGKPSPYQFHKKVAEALSKDEGLKGLNKHKKINIQSFDSQNSGKTLPSQNNNIITSNKSKELKSTKNYYSNNVTQDLIKEFKSYQVKSKEVITPQHQLPPTAQSKATPYDKYKQKAAIESKLQKAPIIDFESNNNQVKHHTQQQNQKQTAKYGSNIRLNENPSKMKAFNSHQQFQILQKGAIKSIKILEKQTQDTTKEDAKFLKEMSKIESQEKNLKTQIDKIHSQIEKRKKDEEVTNVKVQCLYQQKLEEMRKHEQRQYINKSISNNTSNNVSQHNPQQNNSKVNIIRKEKVSEKSTIEGNKTDRSLSNQTDNKFVNTQLQQNQQSNNNKQDLTAEMKPGYQQLNRVNYAKIGINQTPKAQINQRTSNLKERVSKVSRQGNMQDSNEPEIKVIRSPGYQDQDPFTNISAIGKNVQKSDNIKTNFKINPNPTNFATMDDDFNERSLVMNEVSDKSNKKLNQNIKALRKQLNESTPVDKNQIVLERNSKLYKHDSLDDVKNENNTNQSIMSQKKFIYRPLTANLRPNNKQDENFQSVSPGNVDEQQNVNESQVNQSRIDLNMVVKSTSSRFTREDLIKLKQRQESLSPVKTCSIKQNQLEIIQESSFINNNNNNNNSNRDVKRVSFKESSKEIASQNVIKSLKEFKQEKQEATVNNNFRYNKDVAEMHLGNPNIVNRKSFEQTFNPKKDGKSYEDVTGYNGTKHQPRAQSVLQSYKEQVINRKNKQHFQDKTLTLQPNQDLIDDSNRKQYMRSMIGPETTTQQKHSILKNATIEPVRTEKIDRNALNQKINNYTLNETLKIKINQEENKREPRGNQDPNQTINSRENKSLDKSGIDYMTEARDFTNIISNLKSILHKGKQSTNSNKSFMTLEQRPSHTQSANQSYLASNNGHHQKNNISMSQQNHQTLEQNHFMQPRISLSSQGHHGKDLAIIHEVIQPYYHKQNSNNQDQSMMSNQVRPGSRIEEKRKRDFDMKLQRDIMALENILTRKHKLQRLANELSIERVTSQNQSTIDANQRPQSSRSSSVHRASTKLMAGQVTFGNSLVKNNQSTPRGQSLNISRKSTQNNFVTAQPTNDNMGTLLQSIKEAEEQLELLKGESTNIEQQIGDLRRLRSPAR